MQRKNIIKLEIPASRVFLGADAQLLGTSLAGARMPLTISLKSQLIEYTYVARLRLAQHCASGMEYTNLLPLFWPLLATKAKTD